MVVVSRHNLDREPRKSFFTVFRLAEMSSAPYRQIIQKFTDTLFRVFVKTRIQYEARDHSCPFEAPGMSLAS